jgi:hypothetical protein
MVRPARSPQLERSPHRVQLGTTWRELARPSRRWVIVALHHYEHSNDRPFVRAVEITARSRGERRLMSEDRFLRLFELVP